MFTFKEYLDFKEVSTLEPEKRAVLLDLKDKHSKYLKFTQWLAAVHAGVWDGSISLAKGRAIANSLERNGHPASFLDKRPVEPLNFKPDGRLAKIYKPQLLGKNPDLSQYSQVGNTWVKNDI